MNKCSDYLSVTEPVADNSITLYGPNNVLPEEKILCNDKNTNFDLSVKDLTSNEKTDNLNATVSVPKNSVTLADSSNVSLQRVIDIEDHLVSNDEVIYLDGTDSEPKNTIALYDSSYVISPQKLKDLSKNETSDIDLPVEKFTYNEETDSEIDSNSVSKNTLKLEDLSYVTPQIVSNVNQLIPNEEVIIIRSSDSMPQKAAMSEDCNYYLHQDFDHADSLPWKAFALKEDPNYTPPQQVITPTEETDNLNSNSVPQDTELEGPSQVSVQVVADIVDKLISSEEIIYLGRADSVQQKTSTFIDLNYVPYPPLLTSNGNGKTDHLNDTDSVPKNTASLDNPDYDIPHKKLKVLCKNHTKDNNSCVKKLSSNEDTDYSNDISLPQNTAKLEDPGYVLPQVVSDVDQLISNNEMYLVEENSVQQKTAMPGDCNYVQQRIEFVQADSMPQKTLALKDDPNYVPPQQVFENEKADIVDPRWETVKELTSNEERYKQVKACWGSSTVPDPDKNLTYHSFRRKKILKSGEVKQRVKQHKRKASTVLNNETKRPCTYIVDKEINEAVKQKEEKSREIRKEMNRVIDELKERHYQEEICYGNNMAFNYRTGGNSYYSRTYQNTVLTNLRLEHQRELHYVRDKYNKKTFECTSKIDLKLNDLENIRQEVLQFYTFYKGMGINIEKDPTVLTEFQLKVVNDIETFYKQMKSFYK